VWFERPPGGHQRGLAQKPTIRGRRTRTYCLPTPDPMRRGDVPRAQDKDRGWGAQLGSAARAPLAQGRAVRRVLF